MPPEWQVITKLVLSVKAFGEYGRCNICVNGTDHHGNNSCMDGAYWCSCGSFSRPSQCGPAVGAENISQNAARRSCYTGSPEWDCWKESLHHLRRVIEHTPRTLPSFAAAMFLPGNSLTYPRLPHVPGRHRQEDGRLLVLDHIWRL